MLSYQGSAAITVVSILLVSGIVAGVAVTGTAAAATEITECTTIDQPGEYILANDITNESTETCIGITSSDVTFDGNGYTIDGVDRNGTGIESDVGSTATVRNVTVTGFERGAYNVDTLRGSELSANTVGVRYYDTTTRIENTVVSNNTQRGIYASLTTVTILDSRIVDNGDDGLYSFYGDVVLEGTTVARNDGAGMDSLDTTGTFSDNIVTDNDGVGVLLGRGSGEFSGDRITDNGEEGLVVYGNLNATNVTVSNNTDDGILFQGSDLFTLSVNIFDSVVTDNGGDGVSAGQFSEVTIHGSIIASNDGLGVHNELAPDPERESNASAIVNATSNYWGASDGPSSTADPDAPFADPITGTLADGSGDEVSERPTDNGTSNVHFDPFLSEAPGTDDESGEDASTAYQIDVARGGVIEDLGADEDAFYGRQGRLLQAMSVLADGDVTDAFRVPDGEVTRSFNGCTVTYDGVAFHDADGTATLDVSVEDCENGITLTLAAYELPDGTVEFQRDVADRQELVAYETVTLEEGETTVSISIHESEE